MSEQEPRPTQATVAGALVILGSLVVVLGAWERISTLQTLESQRALETWLRDASLTGSVGVEGLSTTIRVMCVVGAAAATAAIVLGVQTFKRSLSARVVLTALSPLLLLGGAATGVFLAPMAVLGVALLWARPTRDWYAGRPWVAAEKERREARAARLQSQRRPEAPARPDPFAPPAPPMPPVPPAAPGAQDPAAPAAPAPWGAPPGQQQPWGQPPAPQPWGQQQQWAPPVRAERGMRPRALVSACVLTWVGSALAAIAFAVSALAVGAQRSELYDDMVRQQPAIADQLSEQDVVIVIYAMLGAFVVWCLVAAGLAALAYAGRNWARITLIVSAVGAALLTVVMAIGAPPVLLVLLLLGASIRLLLRPEVSAWYRA